MRGKSPLILLPKGIKIGSAVQFEDKHGRYID